MAITKTERATRNGEYIKSEANGSRSREQVTVEAAALATAMLAGTVLAKRTSTGLYGRFAVGGADGMGTAVAINFAHLDVSAANKRAVISARDMEANAKKLVWPSGITGPQKTAAEVQLAAQGIVARY